MSSAVVMSLTGSVPTPPSSYAVAADIRYGSDGDVYGAPELAVGQGSNFSTGRIAWDSNGDPDTFFDSGEVPVDFEVPAGGGASNPATLSVAGQVGGAVSNLATYSSIGSVVIDTGTQINGSVGWSDLQIKFLNNGTVVDSWSSTAGAEVDTTDASNPVAGQQIIVTPTSSQTVTSVEITGSMEMTAPPDSYPDTNDLFSDLFIIGAT